MHSKVVSLFIGSRQHLLALGSKLDPLYMEEKHTVLNELRKNRYELAVLIEELDHAYSSYTVESEASLVALLEQYDVQIENLEKVLATPRKVITGDLGHVLESVIAKDNEYTDIDLARKFIGLPGVQYLSCALTFASCRVLKLDLTQNDIGPDSMSVLSGALRDMNCRVNAIDLSWNALGDEGLQLLAEVLTAKNCRVTDVKLSFMQIGNGGALALAAALHDPRCRLKNLDLSMAMLDDHGQRAIGEALCAPVCKVIDFKGWNLHDAILNVLIERKSTAIAREEVVDDA